ncbi:PH domain-containing protein [Streptomyces sp. NPDC050448]|uniref:PH domain-containing protein n=1 Tax=Streptomyces sp. NPDC050448 TaxID=3155404 RepID=UPI0034182267
MAAFSQPYAEPVETGTAGGTSRPEWVGLPDGLLTLRRLLLVIWTVPLAAGTALLLGLTAGPAWAAAGAFWPAVLVWGRVLLGRNRRSWRYAERADDLLISRGVLWRAQTVVPYGRMQLVEVTSGPLERRLARLRPAAEAAGLLDAQAARSRTSRADARPDRWMT